MRKLVIFGTGDLAEIAYEYFSNDSEYDVVGFTVDRDFLPAEPYLRGLPVVPFDVVQEFFPAGEHYMHVAVVYHNMNRDRAQTIERAKAKDYRLASYVSSKAYVAKSAKLGEHVFIFEDNTIQPYTTIGNNCILWSGNHIGHHSVLRDNIFISSHVVISGHCTIGSNCFIGVNATLANNISLGSYSWVSPGAVLNCSTSDNSMVLSVQAGVQPLNEPALTRALSRVKQRKKETV